MKQPFVTVTKPDNLTGLIQRQKSNEPILQENENTFFIYFDLFCLLFQIIFYIEYKSV